ncbi:MAG: hypothetical protein QM749_03820, partial [Aquabacterium sp.]
SIRCTKYANAVKGTVSAGKAPDIYATQAAATTAGATYYLITDNAVGTGMDATTTLSHDVLGHQTKITDAQGYTESMSYDALGNKNSYTNKLGGTYYYTYWRTGSLKTEKLPEGAYAYDAAGNPTGAKQDVINYYEYDARGNRTKAVEAQGRPAPRCTSTMRWTARQKRAATPSTSTRWEVVSKARRPRRKRAPTMRVATSSSSLRPMAPGRFLTMTL